MIKIRAWIEMSLVGCYEEVEFEVDDDASDDEIEDIARDEVMNKISWGWDRGE